MNKIEYILIKIMEEAAELQQAASKAVRFGLYNVETESSRTNLARLRDEWADLQVAISSLENIANISLFTYPDVIDNKMNRLDDWLKVSQGLGVVT